jgi:hypothetical protein
MHRGAQRCSAGDAGASPAYCRNAVCPSGASTTTPNPSSRGSQGIFSRSIPWKFRPVFHFSSRPLSLESARSSALFTRSCVRASRSTARSQLGCNPGAFGSRAVSLWPPRIRGPAAFRVPPAAACGLSAGRLPGSGCADVPLPAAPGPGFPCAPSPPLPGRAGEWHLPWLCLFLHLFSIDLCFLQDGT